MHYAIFHSSHYMYFDTHLSFDLYDHKKNLKVNLSDNINS